MKMDLLPIILHPDKLKPTCFLCLKQKDESLSIHQELFVCDEYHSEDTSLADIMNYLFPSFDILTNEACQDCLKALITTYTRLRRHNFMRQAISQLTRNLMQKVNSFKLNDVDSKVTFDLRMSVLTEKNSKTDEKCVNILNSLIELSHMCKKCKMKFSSQESLSEHNKLAHKYTNHSVICEFCGKDCERPSTLRVHLNCHKEKVCPYCLKTLKSHSHFKLHIKNHTTNVRHPKRVTRYRCNLCNYNSESKNCLEAHTNKVHLQQRPYICDICYKSFYRKSNLTEHISTHKKVKNFTCNMCGDDFVSGKTLAEHIRLHTGEKPYECEICNKRFVSSGRRSDHIKSRHMEKTNSCYLCDKKFGLKKELNSHIKRIHGQPSTSF